MGVVVTSEQADLLMQLLDLSTRENFTLVVGALRAKGYAPAEIAHAWESLERLSGCAGMSPTVEDCDVPESHYDD